MTVQKLTPIIQSLDRGLVLLDAVAKARGPVSLPQLSKVLDIDRSSVFHLVNTLAKRGYLAQVPGSKEYVLGSAVWSMTSQLEPHELLTTVARDSVAKLAQVTGETTHLVALNGRCIVFLDHELTSHRVGVSASCGSDVPLHLTSVGKALLVDFDREQLVELFGNVPFPTPTKRSIASIDDLFAECKRVKKRGFAIDDEEAAEGIRCVAAPIRDSAGVVIAAIGISAPSHRLTEKRCIESGVQVMHIAGEISEALGKQA